MKWIYTIQQMRTFFSMQMLFHFNRQVYFTTPYWYRKNVYNIQDAFLSLCDTEV